ncbi:hypothetical protein N9L15_04115, partial [Euryarchaeota archaeon]|nr:hypothetical protein [Euryarchaeota archaeon]
MSLESVNLDRGFFHFTTPYRWYNWIFWIIGFILVIAGAATLSMEGGVLSAFGFLAIALFSPPSLEADLHNVRKNAP